MSAWVLPDHIADVLPQEARHIEELRRVLLDTARHYGCELVIPPMLEHLESLLTGASEALDLQTFKLVDQLSGRTLGLRPDTTSQVARIDAHLLNRKGVTRLCYCGPVVHTRPSRPHASREPLQFGIEIYGHAGREADLEALLLALDCLKASKLSALTVDLSDARIFNSLIEGHTIEPNLLKQIRSALGQKDASTLHQITQTLNPQLAQAIVALLDLSGGANVLDKAKQVLPPSPALNQALDDLAWLDSHLEGKKISFGTAVSIQYKGSFLSGEVFNNTIGTKQFLDFYIGQEMQVLKGIEEALLLMRDGEKMALLLPSWLAFGEEGNSTGIIPPNTPVYYELTVKIQ